jgi:hypothetical protein
MAQHQGYHTESNNARLPVLEAEMRRRLWWALVIFDARVCETFTSKTTFLGPTWDCAVPLNLSDFDLRADMKRVPPVHERPTEALFVSVRSSLSDVIRHSAFHLDFIDPLLTTLSRAKKPVVLPGVSEDARLTPEQEKKADRQALLALQQTLEATIFAHCDPENTLHFMTIWTVRGYLAKNWLIEHCSWPSPPSPPSPLHPPSSLPHHFPHNPHHPNPGITHALYMLQSDTQLLSSPLTQNFHWHIQSHFPFLAYAYIVHYLKKRPAEAAATTSVLWQTMDENFEARKMDFDGAGGHQPLFVLFARVILQAWEAVVRQDASGEGGKGKRGDRVPPRIVERIKRRVAEMQADRGPMEGMGTETGQQAGGAGGAFGVDEASTSGVPFLNVGGDVAGEQASSAVPDLGSFLGMLPSDPGMESMDMDQLWPITDWGMMQGQSW